MKNKTSRRQFIKTAALLSGGLLMGSKFAFGQYNVGHVVPILPTNPAILFHPSRCSERCTRCFDFCETATGGIFEKNIPEGEEKCVHCGQCTLFCPRLALTEQYHYQEVAQAIADPDKIVVVTTAPSIRVSFGEMYGLEPGTNVEGEIVGALRQLGVDYVFDATFAADLTIMEEASELMQKREKGQLPLFTSCCPSWVRYIKLLYPNYYSNISTVKSPLLMQGALVKTWFAKQMDIDPARIVCVAIAPSTGKKAEIQLPEMNSAGVWHGQPQMRDVDFVLTTRELAYLLNENDIDFLQAPSAPFDSLMGTGSGSAMAFGATGGVMTAALRTTYRMLNHVPPPDDFINFQPLDGFQGVTHATVDMGDFNLNVAAIHGVGNVSSFLEQEVHKYDFVEVMACPSGCIGGGGQPLHRGAGQAEAVQMRANALRQHSLQQGFRISFDNPDVQKIYAEFLGEPLGAISKKLLHVER